MSDPIEYTIVRHLQAALGAMTVAGGYHYAVAAVVVKLDPNHDVEALVPPDGPRPFVLIQLAPERWAYQKANRIGLGLAVLIHWVGEATLTADESRMLTYFRGCADVERAIAVDISRGGLAVDTKITKRTCDESPGNTGARVWAILDVEIPLYRTYGAPDGV